MAQGRGGASNAVVLGVVLFCLLMSGPLAEAARTYTVGDYAGWTIKSAGWLAGKTFHAGDVLVFKYNPTVHNVAIVNATGYRRCSVKGARVLQTGRDYVKLRRGTNYFICGAPRHCQGGMKIAVRAF